MSAYRVDLDRPFDVVDQMTRVENQLLTALEDVDRQVHRLHATWTGAAAAAHQQAHRRWAAGAAEMQQALVVLRRIADGAQANYGSAVSANSRMWAL